MKKWVYIFLIYTGLFFLGYLGLGILVHYYKPNVHMLPDFVESLFDSDSRAPLNVEEGKFEDLSYNILGENKQNERIVFTNDYNSENGIFCFRGNAQRNAPTRGLLPKKPTKIEVDWEFTTQEDTASSRLGVWRGGTGWTGQPLLVRWPKRIKQMLYGMDINFIKKKDATEVIVGSLCGDVYFLDFETGQPTRKELTIDNPIKGTVSVDPRMNGLLYVGQGIPNRGRFGAYVFNMFAAEEVKFRSGLDPDAYRQWGAFDSNSLIDPKSGYWIHPAENGMIYKTKVSKDQEFSEDLKFRYKVKDRAAFGIESSFGAWNNLGFFGDNSGNVFCLNLMTMKPLWHFDNLDDTDAAMVVDIEKNGSPFLYIGNEVDKQGEKGMAYIRKLNAKTGKEIWKVGRECVGYGINGKVNSGGVLASVLPGKKKASNLVFGIFSRVQNSLKGEFVAINKYTGKVQYSITMEHYSWASPIDLYDEAGNCYVFFTDVFGNVYLIDGLTGKIIDKIKMPVVWESSPVAWNDRIVLGARGNKIYSFRIQ